MIDGVTCLRLCAMDLPKFGSIGGDVLACCWACCRSALPAPRRSCRCSAPTIRNAPPPLAPPAARSQPPESRAPDASASSRLAFVTSFGQSKGSDPTALRAAADSPDCGGRLRFGTWGTSSPDASAGSPRGRGEPSAGRNPTPLNGIHRSCTNRRMRRQGLRKRLVWEALYAGSPPRR